MTNQLDPDALSAAFADDFAAERYRAATDRAQSLDLDGLPDDSWEKLIATVLRCRVFAGAAIDQVVITARAALTRAKGAEAIASLHGEIAYALERKRVAKLANAAAEAAVAAWPESSLGAAALGYLALRFDDRDRAVEHYTRATTLLDPRRGWFGLAQARYVLGDFAGSAAALDQLEVHPRNHVAALRMRTNLARVQSDWPTVLTHLDAILAATPDGDLHRRDRLSRASALVAMGERAAGIELYRAVWRDAEQDREGAMARAVLDHVERGGTGRRITLPAFPTVTQKRNYCGPASLELVLRAHGIIVDQDAIAPEVKGDSGSAIVAMTRYLESHGLATRRFEADATRFAACLELGLPVIVQEEYSTTSHVAVVIGIDLGLGLLAVQDPMTHVPSERLVQTQTSLGALYRGAAIVAYPRTDTALASALDAADVIDQRHLRLVDECGDEAVRSSLLDVTARCDEALGLVEDFPLAWYQRTGAMWRQFTRVRTKVDRARFVTALYRARVRYPELEWPHLLHAEFLMDENRWDEALIELAEAMRRDPGDSNTAQNIAECHQQAARDDEATAGFWNTLAVDASHVRATENFARHQLERGELDNAEHLAACALELAPDNPFNHVTASLVADKRGDRAGAIVHARRAVELSPDYSHGVLRLAALLCEVDASDDERAEAVALYLGTANKWTGWFEPRWRAARQLERQGDVEPAVTLLLEGLELATDEPESLLSNLTEILLEDGQDDRAATVVQQHAARSKSPDMQSQLWQTLDEAGQGAATLAATGGFLKNHPTSPFAQASHGARLASLGVERAAEAEALFRSAIEGSPTYDWSRGELANLIFGARPDEALAVLDSSPNAGVEWLALRKTHLLSSIERWDQAAAALPASWNLASWTAQEAYNRVALRDDSPEVALARTVGDDLPARRARLAFAIAAGDHDAAAALFALVPAEDVISQYMANAAASQDEQFRPELARRLAARRPAARASLAGLAYLDAVGAGNAAAEGNTAEFDRWLVEKRNVRQLAHLAPALGTRRQRDLLIRIRARMAEFPHHPTGANAATQAAALRGDLDLAVKTAEINLSRFPGEQSMFGPLVDQQVAAGQLAAAEVPAARLRGAADPWAGELESLALLAIFADRRDEAVTIARRSRQRGFASGYGRSVYWGTRAAEAVLAGDLAGLATVEADSDYPGIALWSQLRARIG